MAEKPQFQLLRKKQRRIYSLKWLYYQSLDSCYKKCQIVYNVKLVLQQLTSNKMAGQFIGRVFVLGPKTVI